MASPDSIFWQYFLALERNFERTVPYVDVVADNYCTYSVVYTQIFLSTCSEIDSLMKMLCFDVDSTQRRENIRQYRDILVPNLPRFQEQEVRTTYGPRLKPWTDWPEDQGPKWWKDHQDVKHNRSSNYMKAHQGNVLLSVSALHIVNLYRHHLKKRVLEEKGETPPTMLPWAPNRQPSAMVVDQRGILSDIDDLLLKRSGP